VAPNLDVAHSDLTVGVGSPHHRLTLLVDKHYERATNVDALKHRVVLKLDLSGLFELSVDSRAPHEQLALLSDRC
jgi:hypothetical protein